TAAGAVAAPSAWANNPRETFCVHLASTPCLPAGAIDWGADLQGALNAAENNPVNLDSPNVVEIGPGTFGAPGGGWTYLARNPLHIVGSGVGTTTLTGGGNVLMLGFGGGAPIPLRTISVSDLSIAGASGTGNAALALFGGSADHLSVTSQDMPLAV